MLPVDAQITACAPLARASVMATVMPRSLNDPVGLAPSTLRWTSHPVSAERCGAGSSGVPPSRRVTTSHDDGHVRHPVAVGLDDPRPLRPRQHGAAAGRRQGGGHAAPPIDVTGRPRPSTRMHAGDAAHRVEVREVGRRSHASAASVAEWVTTTSVASAVSSSVACPSWRTVAMLTPCSAKTPATCASTPARSVTSRLTW